MSEFTWEQFKQQEFPALKALEETPTSLGLMVDRYHVYETFLGGQRHELLETDLPNLEAVATFIESLGRVYFADRDRRCIDLVVARPNGSARVLSVVPFLPESLKKRA